MTEKDSGQKPERKERQEDWMVSDFLNFRWLFYAIYRSTHNVNSCS